MFIYNCDSTSRLSGDKTSINSQSMQLNIWDFPHHLQPGNSRLRVFPSVFLEQRWRGIAKTIMALKLVNISRFFFFAIVLTQAFTLAKYQVQYKDDDDFYGLAALFFFLSLAFWIIAIWKDSLLYCLWFVWFLYSVALVIMIGVIFGGIVMKNQPRNDNFCGHILNGTFCAQTSNGTFCGPVKNNTFCATVRNGTFFGQNRDDTSTGPFPNDAFFGPNVLKSTLSLAPVQMLLLLTSTTDQAEVLMKVFITAIIDLFDGMEMLEVLLQDKNNAIDEEMKIAILTTVIIFFLFSFLELFQVKFIENESKPTATDVESQSKPTAKDRTKTIEVNRVFQIVLNALFLALRLALWFAYHQDAAIFIAKNTILLFMLVLPYFVKRGWISIECNKTPNLGYL